MALDSLVIRQVSLMTLPPGPLQMSGMTELWRGVFYATHKSLPRGGAPVGVVVLHCPDRAGFIREKRA